MVWSTVIADSQIVAIHAALLPTEPYGVVVYYGDWTGGAGGVGVQEVTHTRVHNVAPEHPDPIESLAADVLPNTDVFCAGQSFAVLLPDNIGLSPDHRLGPMLELSALTGQDVVGVLELDSRWSGAYGNCGRIDFEQLRDGVVRITRLHDKAPGLLRIAPGASVYRTCGRYVCQPHVFEYIERLRPEVRGEFDEVPVYQRIVATGGLLGCLLAPPVFDIGNPRGYLAASAWLHRQQGAG